MKNKELLNRLIEIFQLADEFNGQDFSEEYEGLSMNEVHAVDIIGKNRNTNTTLIAQKLGLTKSGVLKILNKLLEKEYIERFQIPENRKEKYFSLTSKGENIFKKHLELHKISEERDSKIFEKFSNDEKETISKFLEILKNDLKNKISCKI